MCYLLFSYYLAFFSLYLLTFLVAFPLFLDDLHLPPTADLFVP